MRRSQSVKLLVLFLSAAAVTVTSAYLLLRDPQPDKPADEVAATWPKVESLEDSLKRQFVGKPTSQLLRHFRIDFDALNLQQEPPCHLSAVSFYVRLEGIAVRVRIHFAGADDSPSRWLMDNDWTNEFVGSLKISDFEIEPSKPQ